MEHALLLKLSLGADPPRLRFGDATQAELFDGDESLGVASVFLDRFVP